MMMAQHWLGKTKPNKLSDRPKTLSKSCYRIKKKNYLMEFSTD